MKVKFALKFKLMFYTLFFIIISSVGLGYIADTHRYNFLQDKAKQDLKDAFYDVNIHFKSIEENIKEKAFFISKNKTIIEYLQKQSVSDAQEKQILDMLLYQSTNFSGNHISVYDTNKNLLAFIDKDDAYSIQGYSSISKKQISYYTKPINSKDKFTKDVLTPHIDKKLTITNENTKLLYKNKDNTINIIQISKIINKKNETVGYVKIDTILSMKDINKLVNKRNLTVRYILDTDENYNTEKAKYTSLPSIFSNFNHTSISVLEYNNIFHSASKLSLSNSNALIIVEMDNRSFYKSVNENRTNLLVVVAIIILLTIVLSLLILNSIITIPLRNLINGIEKVIKGDYDYEIKIKTNDELGLISQKFNEMSNKISQRENDLDALVHQDILTKIPNRIMFNEKLEDAISRAKRLNKKIAVFFLDLDEFKYINDTLGHEIGDKFLIKVSNNLVNIMRRSDLLARIGGDEFNILVEDLDSLVIAQDIAKKLLNQISIPLKINGHILNITGSIGVSIFPIDAEDSVSLLKNADLAMYEAKNNGKNRYQFFNEELSKTLKERSVMLDELKQALSKNEFELYYQPKFSLKNGSIEACEALIRWKSPKLGFVSPENFIPLCEESGEIIKIGKWVIQQACRDFAEWKKSGLNIKQVSVNVSNIQFQRDDVVKIVKNALELNKLDPAYLEVEITESYVHKDTKNAIDILHNIRNLGVDLAMDDFGTGYSSMSYLKRLPLTRLKIDKAFIDDLPFDSDDVEITKIIIALSKVMNLSITAEGIESMEQLRFLQELGCDEGQGFICSKPIPQDQFVELLEKKVNCISS